MKEERRRQTSMSVNCFLSCSNCWMFAFLCAFNASSSRSSSVHRSSACSPILWYFSASLSSFLLFAFNLQNMQYATAPVQQKLQLISNIIHIKPTVRQQWAIAYTNILSVEEKKQQSTVIWQWLHMSKNSIVRITTKTIDKLSQFSIKGVCRHD